eukprot:2750155-Amphidinium_carterae.1
MNGGQTGQVDDVIHREIRILRLQATAKKSEARQQYQNALDELKQFSDKTLEQWLRSRRLFEQQCLGCATWTACPFLEWPTLVSSSTALDAVPAIANGHCESLAAAWEQRHMGFLAAAKRKDVRPATHVPCRFGVCVCRGSNRILLGRLIAFIKKHAKSDLVGGEIILGLEGFHLDNFVLKKRRSTEEKEEEEERMSRQCCEVKFGSEYRRSYFHLSACNLKPFRCTFIEVEMVEESRPDGYATFKAMVHEGKPILRSIFEVVGDICTETAWDVKSLLLSSRESPMPSINGAVRAKENMDIQASRIWTASWESRKKERAPKLAHESLLAEATSNVDLVGSASSAPFQDLPDVGNSVEDDDLLFDLFGDHSAEEDEADFLDELNDANDVGGGSSDDNNDDYPDATAEVPTPDQPAANPKSSLAESSSSSETSSSDSSSASDGGDGPDPTTTAAAADKMSEEIHIQRAVQEGTHVWGPFRLTFRPGSGVKKAQWQATCRFHAAFNIEGSVRTRCTRSCAISSLDPASPESITELRKLKEWLTAGHCVHGKDAHQKMKTTGTMSDADLEKRLKDMPEPPELPHGSTPKKEARSSGSTKDEDNGGSASAADLPPGKKQKKDK